MTEAGCPPETDTALNWVLGTLGSDEAEPFGRHLATCPRCRADVAGLQHVADALADAPAPSQPPAAIRDRLMAVAEEEAAMSRALDDVDARPAPKRRRTRPIALVSAFVVLLLAAVVAAAALRSGDDDNPPPAASTLVGTVSDDGGGSRARAAVVTRGGTAELVLTDLAGPPRGRVYQAWVVRPPAAPLPTGALFSVPRDGETRVRLPDLRGAERVIVTAEPPRGSRIPTPPPRVTVLVPG